MRTRIADSLTVVVALGCSSPKASAPVDAGTDAGDTDAHADADASHMTFPLQGRRYDPVGDCLFPLETVDNVPLDSSCGQAETYAFDADGACWWFASTCIPQGWTTSLDCGTSPNVDGRLCLDE